MTSDYFDGLVQERRNSIANALELRLSCTNPSTCNFQRLLTYVFVICRSSPKHSPQYDVVKSDSVEEGEEMETSQEIETDHVNNIDHEHVDLEDEEEEDAGLCRHIECRTLFCRTRNTVKSLI